MRRTLVVCYMGRWTIGKFVIIFGIEEGTCLCIISTYYTQNHKPNDSLYFFHSIVGKKSYFNLVVKIHLFFSIQF